MKLLSNPSSKLAVAIFLTCAACTPQAAPPPARAPSPIQLEYRFKRLDRVESLVIDFTLTNRGDTPVRDVRIECAQTTESGAHLASTNVIVAGPIAPHATVVRADVVTGFLRPSLSRVECTVAS
jgi:hypothetical protein